VKVSVLGCSILYMCKRGKKLQIFNFCLHEWLEIWGGTCMPLNGTEEAVILLTFFYAPTQSAHYFCLSFDRLHCWAKMSGCMVSFEGLKYGSLGSGFWEKVPSFFFFFKCFLIPVVVICSTFLRAFAMMILLGYPL
jgi:hypothetical protein